MTLKCTWLFNGEISQGSDSLPYGFSESWYTQKAEGDALDSMDRVSDLRRGILARGCSIVGHRITDGAGASRLERVGYAAPGNNDWPNLPVDAALCQVRIAGAATIKKFWLHNLPDDWVNKGHVVGAEKAKIRRVIESYVDTSFQARYQVLNAASAEIMSISDAGLVTTRAPHTFIAGNEVTLLRCRDINGRTKRGKFIVGAGPTATTFTLTHWAGFEVARSGKIRLVTYGYGNATSMQLEGLIRGGARKVGRPFYMLRGRAPART